MKSVVVLGAPRGQETHHEVINKLKDQQQTNRRSFRVVTIFKKYAGLLAVSNFIVKDLAVADAKNETTSVSFTDALIRVLIAFISRLYR